MVDTLKSSVSYRQSGRESIIARGKANAATAPKIEAETGKSAGYVPKGREIHDTIDIGGGNKIINIARGYDLAKQVKAEKDPEKLRELIAQGSIDIKRIGRLFQGVFQSFKTAFGFNRSY